MYDSEMAAPDGEIGAGFDEYLFYLLFQVTSRRNRDFAPALETIGLSLSEWRAMSVINRLDGCLMSELANFTTVDRTTLTRTIDHLVGRGLVDRDARTRDRRQVLVVLTKTGSAVFEQAVDALKAHNAQALTGLSEVDLRTLRGLLQRVLNNIMREPEDFERIMKFER